MKKYRLIVDSSCDLTPEQIEKYDIGVTDLFVRIGERIYRDRIDITSKEILKAYDETKVLPRTAALNIADLEEVFKENLKNYDHIFYMPISSKISSTYSNAKLAAQDLQAEDRITVLDSASLSGGISLCALGVCNDIQAGLDHKAIEANHNERVKRVYISFVIQTMEFLHKGGRCSGMTYLIGNTLHLHPIIKLSDGKMGVQTIVRGKDIKKGVDRLVEDFIKQFESDNIDLNYPIFIPHCEGDYAVKRILSRLKPIVGEEILKDIGTSGIIVCHCGRDTVGIGYMLRKPLDK